ncbi:MAG: hypothetical protein AMS25_03325 [Gemmatimonas sp. SM23_52]|nr:MAG: hypothetical protein AMS25_03325 [Gemmatimonas sp. SM23_52]
MRDGLRLAPAIFRFLGQDVIRTRRIYFSVLLGSVAGVQMLLALRAPEPGLEGLATIHMLTLWIVAAPLCRSWLDEDVRLGYAAFWLQKPLTTFEFYLAWLLALVGWSIVAAATLSLACLPAFASAAGSPWEIAGVLLGTGWIPTLLVVLSFCGSALGARNSGLFAYGVLFAGFATPGFADAVWLGPAYDILELILPPSWAALEAVRLLRAGSVGAALLELQPIVLYTIACASLALLLALNTPVRLSRAE